MINNVNDKNMMVDLADTGERPILGKIPATTLQAQIGRYFFASNFIKEGDYVLDIACGIGYGTAYLADKAGKVIGGDIDKQSIKYARSVYSKKGTAFLTLNCTQLPFRNQCFDVVVSIETIEHLEDYEAFLEECHRVLKDDGVFVCTTPNRETSSPCTLGRHHIHEFTLNELQNLLKKEWTDVTIYGQCYVSRVEQTKRMCKQYLFKAVNRYLSIAPKGDKIKNFVTRYFLRQGVFPACTEISNEKLDEKYSFYRFEGGRPLALGAVAKNSSNK